MREKEVEQALVRSVKKAGGLCMKFTCPGMDGVPDRLVLLPFGKCAFVELKAPGKKPRPLQIRRMKQITALGIPCYVIDAKEQIGEVIKRYDKEQGVKAELDTLKERLAELTARFNDITTKYKALCQNVTNQLETFRHAQQERILSEGQGELLP